MKEFKIVICVCPGNGKSTWRKHEVVKVSVFIPSWFLRTIWRLGIYIEKSVGRPEILPSFDYKDNWNHVQENPHTKDLFRFCGFCPKAPRDDKYCYPSRVKEIYYTEEKFNEIVKKIVSDVKKAYDYLISLPTYKQHQVVVDFEEKQKTRVDVLKEELNH